MAQRRTNRPEGGKRKKKGGVALERVWALGISLGEGPVVLYNVLGLTLSLIRIRVFSFLATTAPPYSSSLFLVLSHGLLIFFTP